MSFLPRTFFAIAAICLCSPSAFAQSNPSPAFSYGSIPTAGQWNSFFAAKQDYLGATPFLTTGGTFTGKVSTVPSTTLLAGLNIGMGAAPTTPIDGDIWATTGGLWFQAGGATFGPVLTRTSGSSPVNSGSCAINTQVGGNTAGTFQANGSCSSGTIILTFATSAPNGWICFANDRTTRTDLVIESADSPTTATFSSVTMAASDVVQFACTPY